MLNASILFKKIEEDLSKKEAIQTRELFCYRAEIYNIDLIFRVKAFYNNLYPYKNLSQILLPYYGVLKRKDILKLAASKDLDEFLEIYNNSKAVKTYGPKGSNMLTQTGVLPHIALRKKAIKLLRFSIVPETVLAALLCFADIERSNIVTVVEGVRYGLAPEKIESFLKL